MGEWQDIETAPKDGTDILGFDEDGRVVVWWDRNAWIRRGDDYDIVTHPTHWQPLPPPPKDSGDQSHE